MPYNSVILLSPYIKSGLLCSKTEHLCIFHGHAGTGIAGRTFLLCSMYKILSLVNHGSFLDFLFYKISQHHDTIHRSKTLSKLVMIISLPTIIIHFFRTSIPFIFFNARLCVAHPSQCYRRKSLPEYVPPTLAISALILPA